MTWLKFLNMFILQWFFIRLAKKVNTKTLKIEGWKIVKWVVPTTGWNTDYKFVDIKYVGIGNKKYAKLIHILPVIDILIFKQFTVVLVGWLLFSIRFEVKNK